MGKRKWQTVVFILLIGVFSFAYIRLNDLFFSPEDVFWSCERGLRSGPSEKIIAKYEIEDGGTMLIGLQEEGLFLVPAERYLGIFWRMKQGTVDGYMPFQDVFGMCLQEDGSAIGLSRDPEVAEVMYMIGCERYDNWMKYTENVREDGLILRVGEENAGNWKRYNAQFGMGKGFAISGAAGTGDHWRVYLEARDAEGDVLFTGGDEALLEDVRTGKVSLHGEK